MKLSQLSGSDLRTLVPIERPGIKDPQPHVAAGYKGNADLVALGDEGGTSYYRREKQLLPVG